MRINYILLLLRKAYLEKWKTDQTEFFMVELLEAFLLAHVASFPNFKSIKEPNMAELNVCLVKSRGTRKSSFLQRLNRVGRLKIGLTNKFFGQLLGHVGSLLAHKFSHSLSY